MLFVYHAICPSFEPAERFDATTHKLVAVVATHDPDVAYEATQSAWRPWQDNPEIVWALPGPQRSTSVGDVLYGDSWSEYETVGRAGFRSVPLTGELPAVPRAALHAIVDFEEVTR